MGVLHHLDNIREAEEALKNYYWMTQEIEREQFYLQDAGEGLNQRYEINGGGRPQGRVSDPVYRETFRRKRRWDRIEKLGNKVRWVDMLYDDLKSEQQRTMLACLMDGMSMREISKRLRISRMTANRIRRKFIDQLSYINVERIGN